MRKYVVTSDQFEGSLVFGFNAENMLLFYENKAVLSTKHLAWLAGNFPVMFNLMTTTFTKAIIKEVTDLTFERFWSEYNLKVGDKRKAEKLWNQLSETEKIDIFDHLKKYFYYLRTTNIAQAHPTTFLNQRRWENTLPVK